MLLQQAAAEAKNSIFLTTLPCFTPLRKISEHSILGVLKLVYGLLVVKAT